MFIELEALARRNPLLITISPEGDSLRVTVTPTPADSKTKQSIQPVSLVGTAAELDEGLAAALITWQAPRKSLQEQAEAAAGGGDASTAPAKAPTQAKPAPGKPGPKPKVKPGSDGATPAPGGGATSSAAAGADSAAPAPGDGEASSAAAGADGAAPAPGDGATSSAAADADAPPIVSINEPPPGATRGPAADRFTLDIF